MSSDRDNDRERRKKKRNPAPVPTPKSTSSSPDQKRYSLKTPVVADFSSWDGQTDITTFRLGGIYTRATYNKTPDWTYHWYRQQAKILGLPFGAYHFFYAHHVQEQINAFVTVAKDADYLILDAEYVPPRWPLGIRGKELAYQYKYFLDGVEKITGKLPWIYTSLNSWSFTGFPLWAKNYPLIVAYYPDHPDLFVEPTYGMIPQGFIDVRGWQYADDGRSQGYAANDLGIWLR